MLLQFNFKNFKSFKDDTTLDLTATKISEFNNHVISVANERILPVAAIEMVVILMASSESLHMSALLAAQLLPHSSRCGGLWQVFKLYCVRFLVFLLPVGIAGVWEVVLRLILGG